MTNLDEVLFRLINGVWINPVMDFGMTFISRINEYGLVWLALLGMLAILGGRPDVAPPWQGWQP
jgi:hypothetical protein